MEQQRTFTQAEQIEQIERQIDTIDGTLAVSASTDFSTNPTLRFMTALYAEFSKQGLKDLCEHIGKIELRISEQFWGNEQRAARIITNFTISFKKMYEILIKNCGDDAKKIMTDNLAKTRFVS